MALQAEEDKKRIERENFLITTIPITVQAAYEPSLYHAVGDDHDEGKNFKGNFYFKVLPYSLELRSESDQKYLNT